MIGSTIGNMIGGAMASRSRASALAELGERSKPSFEGAELAAPQANIEDLLAMLPGVDLGSGTGSHSGTDLQRYLGELRGKTLFDLGAVNLLQEQFGPDEVLPYLPQRHSEMSILTPFPNEVPPLGKEGSGIYHSRKPTGDDYAHYEAAKNLVELATLTGRDDAARNLDHYLHGNGAVLSPDIKSMLSEIPGFSDAVSMNYLGLRNTVGNYISNNYQGGTQKFLISTPWQSHDSIEGNWHFAMGLFRFKQSALVTVSPGNGGQLRVRLDTTLHVFDRYNWDPPKKASIGPKTYFGVRFGRMTIYDADMAKLHQSGLAKEYEIRGSLPRPARVFNFPAPSAVPLRGK